MVYYYLQYVRGAVFIVFGIKDEAISLASFGGDSLVEAHCPRNAGACEKNAQRWLRWAKVKDLSFTCQVLSKRDNC